MAVQLINGNLFYDHDDFITSLGENNDVDAHSTCVIVVTSNNGDSITGFIPESGISGETLWVINNHATNNLLLKHDDSSSTAGYRILLPTGTTLTLAPYEQAQLMYVDTVGRAGWWLKKDGTIS